jgi:hypothetical protein
VVGEADAIFGGLDFDRGERDARFLGFDDADGGTVDIEEIVGETVAFFEGVFADGDALGEGEVDFVAGLDGPTSWRLGVCQFRRVLPVREP